MIPDNVLTPVQFGMFAGIRLHIRQDTEEPGIPFPVLLNRSIIVLIKQAALRRSFHDEEPVVKFLV